MYKTLIMYFLVLATAFFSGCQQSDHYDRPSYLVGNTYEFLEENGNFKLFLEAIDLTGFKTGLDGRGIYSVFAPTDGAVEDYLLSVGKTSLTELNIDTLKVLVGYHIVEYTYTPEDFLGFSKTSTSDDPEIADGYANRFKTLSREPIVTEKHPMFGNPIRVFQKEKFLPVVSTTLLRSKKSPDYKADYQFFFPSVNWKGDVDQFYVAGAAVLDNGIAVDNGYVYIVDKVVEPLRTVYRAFDDKPEYSLFKDMYDRFAMFEYDKDATANYAQALGDSLFFMRHYLSPTSGADLPDISDEWTVAVKHTDKEASMRTTFNSYIPNNTVLDAFCRNYFGATIDIAKIPLLSLFYLLSSHVPYDQDMVLPSDLDKGIEGMFGEKWPLTQVDVAEREFCSNGLFYGINKVLEPAIFTMITEPLFKIDRFSVMASLFHKTQNILPLVDVDRDYTLLLLSKNTLSTTYGMSLNLDGNPSSLDVLGNRIKVYRFANWSKPDYNIVEMSGQEQMSFVQSQIMQGYYDASASGRKYYATSEPFAYLYQNNYELYYENGSKVKFVSNGIYDDYTYSGGSGKGLVIEVENKLDKKKENIAKALRTQNNKFYQELVKANLITFENLNGGMIDEENTLFLMDWLNEERCMVFAPTDAAFTSSVLPEDSIVLDKYLKSHFISLEQNGVDQYTLPQLGQERIFDTKSNIKVGSYVTLELNYIDNDYKALRITDWNDNTIQTDGTIPYFASNGLVYGIVSMLPLIKTE